MLRCAVVEDEAENAELIKSYLVRLNSEHRVALAPSFFPDAVSFLSCGRRFDLVLMDIRMPGMSGMDAARLLRERDSAVQIVFITTLASYALQGYEVGALEFIVKPVNYRDFALKLMRAISRCPDKRDIITFATRGSIHRLCAADVFYLESVGHDVIYHTADSQIRRRASLSACEKEMPEYFCRTNSCYVVNLLLVSGTEDGMLTVGGDSLKISEPRLAVVKKRISELWGEREAQL